MGIRAPTPFYFSFLLLFPSQEALIEAQLQARARTTTTPRQTGFPATLTRLRKAKGWSQQQLAAAAGLTRLTVVKFETGKRVNPAPETIAALAAALEVSAAVLSFSGSEGEEVVEGLHSVSPVETAPAGDAAPTVDDGLPPGLAAFLAAEHDDLTQREKRELCSLRLEQLRGADAAFWRQVRDLIRALPVLR